MLQELLRDATGNTLGNAVRNASGNASSERLEILCDTYVGPCKTSMVKGFPPMVTILVQRSYIQDKVFNNGPSKICGRYPLKKMKGYGLLKQTISLQILQRLSFTSFTLSILEYFVTYISQGSDYTSELLFRRFQLVCFWFYLPVKNS